MNKFLSYVIGLALLICSAQALAFETFVVKKIQIEGAQRISQDAVLRDLGINVGDTINTDRANEAIHDLYKTGFFKDIQLERDGSTLIVKVVERPSIASLEVIGLKNKDEVEKILKENNVAEGRVYDPNIITKVEREIVHKYLTEQRYNVKVDTKVTEDARNRVNIEMNVYEGNVATIKQINFVGNKAFTARQLRKQMFHKTWNWLAWFDKSNHYSKEKLQADLEMLRSFYMDRGYLDFKLESTQVSLSVDKKHVYITISVYEGPQYFFKGAEVSGDLVLEPSELQEIVDKNVKAGKVFSRRQVWKVKEELEARLGEEGYSKANVRIMDDMDENARLVGLKFYIDARKRISVRRITFEGNVLTQDQVLRRELEQFEGSWISTKNIKEGKEALMRKAYASKVDIETAPVLDKDDQVDLIYKIEEQRNANISAGLSYSGANRLALNLGLDLRNCVGTGKDINVAANYGKTAQTYTVGYSDPYFTESGIGFGGNLYHQHTKLSKTSNIFNYSLDATGMSFIWQLRLSKYNYFKVGAGWDYTVVNMNYANSPTEAQNFVNAYEANIPPTKGNMKIGFKDAYLNTALLSNNLNHSLFPTKGFSSSVSAKVSIPGSQLEICTFDVASSWFYPLRDPIVFNLRGDAGYSKSYNGMPYPFYRNYFLGGGESVRGFHERSLGPKDSRGNPYGGNMLVEGRMQFIFPPPFIPDPDMARLALFLDAGQVYDTYNNRDANGNIRNRGHSGIRFSAGVSLTWNTPLNVPIAFSFAWPLNKKQGDSPELFAFSMGLGF